MCRSNKRPKPSRYLIPPPAELSASLLKVPPEKALVFCGDDQSPQPEAIRAGRKVTNYLKPALEQAAVAVPRACRSEHE